MTDSTGIDPAVAPSGTGCVECDSEGGWWVHLRRCAQCGHIGCCNDSLSKHATAHATATGHRFIRSFEPRETWFWDFETNDYYDGPELADPQSRPRDQTSPGPAERLPADWRDLLG
ncbi:MAG TPA: UBP-type zinc finger domain-containing protein [Pseudonocardia sp.]|nr:UBP-type zinc finger domain-containing protein [Pseudonocardia sp.]